MLTEREIRDKLHEYAAQFNLSYLNKEWARAKLLYFRAQTVATFLEMPETDLAELFGNRPYKEDWEPLEPGLFQEDRVEKASWECVRINETYDELHLKPKDKYGYAYVKDWRELGGGIVQVRLEEVGT
ncbi:MAG: hypothetical protein K2N43_07750 [Lachnospiraceae bacterium]|nr:hypothetical protein [Lachnospiraceae bacterium]